MIKKSLKPSNFFHFLVLLVLSFVLLFEGVGVGVRGAVEGEEQGQDQHCGSGGGSEGNCKDNLGDGDIKHRYSKGANEKWKNIYKKIEVAEKYYAVRGAEISNLPEGDCSLYEKLISKDLNRFRTNGITKHLVETARSRGSLYQIIDGKLYREKSCKFPARCTGIEYFLKKIAKGLPDIEFVVNTSDWPQISSHFPDPIPVFSFSKTKDYADITYPAWTFWEGGPAISVYPNGIGRWDLMRESLVTASMKYPWKDKEPKGFFRGSRTSSERDALIYLSRSNPELVDAQYTKNQAWKSDADTLNAPAADEVSLEGHCKFKYLFNYRGVAASFRLKHLFLCKSLVFHVGNEWTEFFYPELKPWIHYIPVPARSTSQELKEILEFAKDNDEIAFKIAERGFDFIKTHLTMMHVTCYWKHLLLQYSKLLNENVTKRADVFPL